MRDEQHRAVEVAQRLHEHLLGQDVEVVRRLVEHEEVRRVEQHQGQHEARLLATAEELDQLVLFVAGELERAEQVALGADRLEVELLVDLLVDGQVRVEQVERLLREVAHLDATELQLAAVGLQVAGDHLQQRRLAGAVLAHDAPALAALDLEVERLVDRARAVGLLQAVDLDDVVARARRRLARERHHLALLRQLDLVDLLDLLRLALRLRGLGDVRVPPKLPSDARFYGNWKQGNYR